MNQKITIAAAFAVCCTTAFIAARALSKDDATPQPGPDGAAIHKTGEHPQAKPDTTPGAPATEARTNVHHLGHAMASRPLKRMKAILGNPSPTIRMEEWTEFITSLESSQIQEVIDEYPVRDAGEPYVHECQKLYQIWGQKDPQTAVEQAMEENYFFRIIALMAVTESWAADDPGAASTWLQKQEDQKKLPDRWRIRLASAIEKSRG